MNRQVTLLGGRTLCSSQMCVRQKNELSLLYYISTSNNALRRVGRKEVESIDISSLIEMLRTPPRPFSLRVYSFLMRGIVKVYFLKLKYCEDEILSVVNGLHAKKTRRRKDRVRVVPKRESFVLQIDDDFIDAYSESECHISLDPVVHEDSVNESSALSVIVENDNDETMDAVPVKKQKKSIIDKKIEIVQRKASLFRTSDCETARNVSFAVFQEFDMFLKASKRVSAKREIELAEFVFYSTPGTIELSQIPDSIPVQYTQEIYDTEPSETIRESILNDECFEFNEKARNFHKRTQAHLFHCLLEFGSRGAVRINQSSPYASIYVNRMQNNFIALQ
eukprot:jgi/Antlo1/587/2332